MPTLLDSLKVGDLTLANRVVMAPLTRMRSKQPGNIPHELNATYYAQRATAGLIISEASQISQQGQGYPGTPGIHSKEQVQGWKLVTDAVHKAGGRIFLQLWHVGRISALDISEIPGIIADYRHGAENAQRAGFDGVEVHGANGYLLDQFLQDGSNQRTDGYGGSIPNRARLLLEVVDQAIAVWGRGRVGVRLSPYGTFNDMHDSDPVALFTYVLSELDKRSIAYVHPIEPRSSSAGSQDANITNAPQTAAIFRSAFKGTLISAGGYTREDAQATVAEGRADAIAFGRLFISNPDLPARLLTNADLSAYDRATFYGGAEKGYTDYPTLG